jgi:hypothetical protein
LRKKPSFKECLPIAYDPILTQEKSFIYLNYYDGPAAGAAAEAGAAAGAGVEVAIVRVREGVDALKVDAP